MAWPLGWPPAQEPTALRTARAVPRGAQGKFSRQLSVSSWHGQAARRAAGRLEQEMERGTKEPTVVTEGSDIPPGA